MHLSIFNNKLYIKIPLDHIKPVMRHFGATSQAHLPIQIVMLLYAESRRIKKRNASKYLLRFSLHQSKWWQTDILINFNVAMGSHFLFLVTIKKEEPAGAKNSLLRSLVMFIKCRLIVAAHLE